MEERPVPNELVGPQGGKGGDRVDEWHHACFRHASSEPNHVLLGHADIEKAPWEGVYEGFERHEPQVCGEQDDSGVALRELDEGTNERLANGLSPLSREARVRTA